MTLESANLQPPRMRAPDRGSSPPPHRLIHATLASLSLRNSTHALDSAGVCPQEHTKQLKHMNANNVIDAYDSFARTHDVNILVRLIIPPVMAGLDTVILEASENSHRAGGQMKTVYG